mmetsp:Transcript_19286/g.36018  ORF Transcript_19286/g.36018 Transcript_19286/m.36018 type:complete len:220 (+) Transcript_19286:206-865(+)
MLTPHSQNGSQSKTRVCQYRFFALRNPKRISPCSISFLLCRFCHSLQSQRFLPGSLGCFRCMFYSLLCAQGKKMCIVSFFCKFACPLFYCLRIYKTIHLCIRNNNSPRFFILACQRDYHFGPLCGYYALYTCFKVTNKLVFTTLFPVEHNYTDRLIKAPDTKVPNIYLRLFPHRVKVIHDHIRYVDLGPLDFLILLRSNLLKNEERVGFISKLESFDIF